MKDFWKKYNLPVQDEFIDLDTINPAEAYRRQADAINYAAPLYDELEHLENMLERVQRVEKELRTKVLSQNMPLPSSSTRTNELIDAFILNCATHFKLQNGETKDVTDILLNLIRRKFKLEHKKAIVERRLRALESMAQRCEAILNWKKHEARLELR